VAESTNKSPTQNEHLWLFVDRNYGEFFCQQRRPQLGIAVFVLGVSRPEYGTSSLENKNRASCCFPDCTFHGLTASREFRPDRLWGTCVSLYWWHVLFLF
jgi:hypothetical protein